VVLGGIAVGEFRRREGETSLSRTIIVIVNYESRFELCLKVAFKSLGWQERVTKAQKLCI